MCLKQNFLSELKQKALDAIPGPWKAYASLDDKYNDSVITNDGCWLCDTIEHHNYMGKDNIRTNITLVEVRNPKAAENSAYIAMANPQNILLILEEIENNGIEKPDFFDDLKRKAQAATPGPWRLGKLRLGEHEDIIRTEYKSGANLRRFKKVNNEFVFIPCGLQRSANGRIYVKEFPVPQWVANAEYISAANPQTILALIEILEEAQSNNGEGCLAEIYS